MRPKPEKWYICEAIKIILAFSVHIVDGWIYICVGYSQNQFTHSWLHVFEYIFLILHLFQFVDIRHVVSRAVQKVYFGNGFRCESLLYIQFNTNSKDWDSFGMFIKLDGMFSTWVYFEDCMFVLIVIGSQPCIHTYICMYIFLYFKSNYFNCYDN